MVAGVRSLQAEAVFAQGRTDEAIQLLEEAIGRAGPDPQLSWRLGKAYLAAGNEARARELWERADRLATGTGWVESWEAIAAMAEQAGDLGRADRYRARA